MSAHIDSREGQCVEDVSDYEDAATPTSQEHLSRKSKKSNGLQRRGNIKKKGAHASKDDVRSSEGVTPPVYPQIPKVHTLHGETRVDNYAWLENRESAKTKSIFHAENDIVSHFFKVSDSNNNNNNNSNTKAGAAKMPLRKRLFHELKSRQIESDISMPYHDGHYWYYVRTVPKAEHLLYCRRPYDVVHNINANFYKEVADMFQEDPNAILPAYEDEIIFLDLNLLVQELQRYGMLPRSGGDEEPFIDVGDIAIAPDEQRAAVMIDCSGGREIFTLFIVQIQHVDYKRWLETHASAMERGLAADLLRQGESYYNIHQQQSLSSPSTKTKESLSAKKGQPRSSPVPSPKETNTKPASLSKSKPVHRLLYKLDLFDLSGEVLWASENALLYIALDEKQRGFQLVYHDLRYETRVTYGNHHNKKQELSVPTPEDAAITDATVVCYEEEDESFWLGPLLYSEDSQFLLFRTGSTDVSEWYAVPTNRFYEEKKTKSNEKPFLRGIPVVAWSSEESKKKDEGEGEQEDEKEPLLSVVGTEQVFCFSKRQLEPSLRKYEVDHHCHLLGPSEATADETGAWMIVTDTNHQQNFAVYMLPDVALQGRWHTMEEKASKPTRALTQGACNKPEGKDATSVANTASGDDDDADAVYWIPLFAYDATITVEDVELYEHFLLFSVRKDGAPTILFCPLSLVWRWWATRTSAEGGTAPSMVHADDKTLLSLRDLLDLSMLLREKVQQSRQGDEEALWLPREVDIPRAVTTTVTVPALHVTNNQDDHGDGTLLLLNTRSKDDKHTPRVTPLPCNLFTMSYSTLFFGNDTWCVTLTHLLTPSLCFLFRYEAQPHNDDDVPGALDGVLHYQLSRKDMVPVTTELPFHEADYEGATIWVPSTYAFEKSCSSSTTTATTVEPTPAEAATAAVCLGRIQPVATAHPAEPVYIPVFVCYKRSLYKPGENPLVLHVYGSYGDCQDCEFSSSLLCLLDRGCVWATAAVRGGGDLGIAWYEAGRLQQHGTTVNDFLSVSAYLQYGLPIAASGNVVSCGSSAGGLTVTRAMHAAPQLFRAVVAAVPFVDVLTSLSNTDLPLTSSDWEEFGNPLSSKATYDLLKDLSPVDTVPVAWGRVGAEGGEVSPLQRCLLRRPHVYLESAWDDARVPYWEPAKLAALYRELDLAKKKEQQQQQRVSSTMNGSSQRERDRVLLHYSSFDGGHGGSSGRFQQLHEIAREYAFILHIVSDMYNY